MTEAGLIVTGTGKFDDVGQARIPHGQMIDQFLCGGVLSGVAVGGAKSGE